MDHSAEKADVAKAINASLAAEEENRIHQEQEEQAVANAERVTLANEVASQKFDWSVDAVTNCLDVLGYKFYNAKDDQQCLMHSLLHVLVTSSNPKWNEFWKNKCSTPAKMRKEVVEYFNSLSDTACGLIFGPDFTTQQHSLWASQMLDVRVMGDQNFARVFAMMIGASSIFVFRKAEKVCVFF